MKIIFQKKKTSGGCTLYLTTRRRRNFYARIHNKYNKILEDLVFTITKTWIYFTAYPGKKYKNYGRKLIILHKYL